MPTEVVALLLAVAAASLTMGGWVIAVIRASWQPRTSGWMLLAAAGAMTMVSVLELLPGARQAGLGNSMIVIWVALGGATVFLIRWFAHSWQLGGKGLQRSALIIAVALAIHNVPEGAAPYAATLLSLQSGLWTALGLGLHNVAEGLAVATPALATGGTRRRAFWLTVMATAGEVGGAFLAFSFAGVSSATAGALVAFVAGVMITVSLAELLPASLVLLRGRSTEERATIAMH